MVDIQDILKDVQELVRREAGRRKVLSLSPEVASLLESLDHRSEVAAPRIDVDTPGAGGPPHASHEEGDVVTELAALEDRVRSCVSCRLCQGRTQTVFGVGNPFAQLVFVGEAPGESEDRQGIPFVGLAGQLLTDIIVKGMKMDRGDVYICNVIKCRPPSNRNPEPDEIVQCEPFLIRQLELVKPKVICALGAFAAQSLLRTTESVGKLRGRWHRYRDLPLRVTYHPAYLLRSPGEKKKAWEDIQAVMRLLSGEETSTAGP